jgi:FkbM family methyltransferase
VVDLGANVGVFTALASVVAGRVISVEAQSGFVDQIYENAARNGARDRVEVEFGLIGAGAGAFSDASVLHSASHFGAEPPTLTMPDLMRRHALDHIDFFEGRHRGLRVRALCGEASGWPASTGWPWKSTPSSAMSIIW